MQRTSLATHSCPIAQTLDVVGDPWTLLVVREAFFGLTRFEEIQAQLGIARNTLAARLRRLVAAGVLETRRYQERPPRDEYRLTRKGRALFPLIATMIDWGNAWGRDGRGAHARLAHRDTGELAELRLVCGRRGTPLTPATVVLKDIRTGRTISRRRGAGPGPAADRRDRAARRPGD